MIKLRCDISEFKSRCSVLEQVEKIYELNDIKLILHKGWYEKVPTCYYLNRKKAVIGNKIKCRFHHKDHFINLLCRNIKARIL